MPGTLPATGFGFPSLVAPPAAQTAASGPDIAYTGNISRRR